MIAAKKTKSPMDGNSNVQAILDFAGGARTNVEFQVRDTIFPIYLRTRAIRNSGNPL
jgi:hypothetical protein